MTNHEINIVYHSSDAYARVLAVSLASLFENNKTIKIINVYIIEHGISEKNKDALDAVAEHYGRNIFYISMPDINIKENLRLQKVKEKWTFDSYCRLFLDDLLPEKVDKVLYLDTDVLVTDSLEELWNIDMTCHLAAGVKDCFSKKYYNLLGIKEGAHYCNSGVLLINLNKWRKEHIGNQIRKYVHDRNGYVFFMEQTVINGVLQDKWLILDVKYNVNTLMMTLSYKELKTLRKLDDFYSKEEIEEAIEHPVLIHMTSFFMVRNRTWVKGTNHPAKQLFDKYKSLTPWKDIEDIPDMRSKKTKIKDKVIDVVPNAIMLPVVSFVYNNIRIINIKRNMKKYGCNNFYRGDSDD